MSAPVTADSPSAPERAAFTAMTEGTQEDWGHIAAVGAGVLSRTSPIA